jgi:hypothetical protein
MYFTLSQKQYLILAVFGGLLLVNILVVAYWSFRLSLTRPDPDEEEAEEEFDPDHLEGQVEHKDRPIPLFVILVIAAVILWGFAYVIAVATGGHPVQ